MKLLGIETSSPVFSVAVSDGSKILAFEQVGGEGPPSLLLTDLIQGVLDKAGMILPGLDGLAVSIGPGSFTGLRIGVMTVKTLAWALHKPVLPVSSLEVIANNLQHSARPVVPFLDARKGNVYGASFAPDGTGSLKRMGPDELLRPEEALRRLSGPAILAGDGLKRYAQRVSSMAPAGVEQADPSLWIPRADLLCRLAAARWPHEMEALSRGPANNDPRRLVPHYLYSQGSG